MKTVCQNLQTCLEKNVFKFSMKLLTLIVDFSNYICKMSSTNWKFFFQKRRLLCFLFLIFSPSHNKNWWKALHVGHLVRGVWLEELVQLQLFKMRKVSECRKGIGLVSNFINFLGENENAIDFLIDFCILYKSDMKTFLRITFSYKLGCTLWLQLHSVSSYWMWQIRH